MGKLIDFKSVAKAANATSVAPMSVSLNKLFITIQYCVLVTGDVKTARELLSVVAESPLMSRFITVPGRFRVVIEETDVEETYRALLGVE